jgi:hypothetical protein
MEALALLAGLQLADQFDAQSLAVESDCLEVIQAVHDPSEYKGTSAVVIDDCRQLLVSLGMTATLHCSQEANGAAHALARHGSIQGVK